MADLKILFEKLSLQNVQTYIQSGNVIFNSVEKMTDSEIAKRIEKAIDETWNFKVPVIVFTADELKTAIENNPFVSENNMDKDKLHVTFLSEKPASEELKKIEGFDFSPDRFIIKAKQVYLYIPGSYGETKLSNKFFENRLKVTATTRNWKTVNKLLEIASSI
jgi:uncharacterized protein (DUF1697 family)